MLILYVMLLGPDISDGFCDFFIFQRKPTVLLRNVLINLYMGPGFSTKNYLYIDVTVD